MALSISVLLTHPQSLSRPIVGRFLAVHSHGNDVEFILDNRSAFSLLWEDARELARLAGPNLSGRDVVYDGHSVIVDAGRRA